MEVKMRLFLGPTRCGAPVLAIHAGLPFCDAHMARVNHRNHHNHRHQQQPQAVKLFITCNF